jgi:large subunit ribosomal protein L25
MPDYTLLAEKRTIFGKQLNRIRKNGQVPAILYGHKIENQPLLVEEGNFTHVFRSAGRNTIIKVEIEDLSSGKKDVRNALIHDVSFDPLTSKPIHIDLYQVRMDEKVRVEVPLVFVGEAPAVKIGGGVLVRATQSVAVEALPDKLPHEIKVDVSDLKTFEDTIYIKDLAFPAGVEILAEPETPVASVAPPRTEAELEALEEKVEVLPEGVKVETEEKRASRLEKEKEEGIVPEKESEK